MPPMPTPPIPPKQPGEFLRENGVLHMDKEFNQDNCMPLVKMIMEYNLMQEKVHQKLFICILTVQVDMLIVVCILLMLLSNHVFQCTHTEWVQLHHVV